METLKKVKATDVYQIAKVSHDALYSALKRLLPPEEMIFAETKKGYDQIFWVHPEGGWISYAQADASLQALIEDAVTQHRERARTQLSSQPNLQLLVDTLFTTPGKEFYYFRFSESGELQVLLSGWGFRKAMVKHVGPGTVHNSIEKKQRVVISFSSQGKAVPHYEFLLHIPAMSRTLNKATDDDGLFVLAEQALVGSKFQLEDPLTEQVFELEVEEGRERYDYDVTIETNDSHPEEDHLTETEPVPPVPPITNHEPEVKEPEPEVKEPGIEIANPDTTEQEPQDELPILPVLHVVGTNEQSVTEFPIEIQYEGQTWNFVTDQYGRIKLPEMKVDHIMLATEAIDHATTSSYQLQAETHEYLFHIPFSTVSGNRDYLIRTEDHNGRPFSGQITFRQSGKPTLLARLDELGQCWLDRNNFLPNTNLEADLSLAQAISSPSLPKVTFQLHDDEKEYLLSLRKPAPSKTWLEILLACLGFLFLLVAFILLIA